MYRSCEFTQFVRRGWKGSSCRLMVIAVSVSNVFPLRWRWKPRARRNSFLFEFSVEVPFTVTRRAEIWGRVCIVTRLSYPYTGPFWKEKPEELNCKPRPQMLFPFFFRKGVLALFSGFSCLLEHGSTRFAKQTFPVPLCGLDPVVMLCQSIAAVEVVWENQGSSFSAPLIVPLDEGGT